MPLVHRLTDITAAHPGPCNGHSDMSFAIMGSPNVLVNGLPVVRMGDVTAVHLCHPPKGVVPHIGIYVGVRNILVNGMPMQCLGDICNCGSLAISGSGNVLAF